LAVAPSERPASARLFADQLADAVGWPGAEAVREALAAMARGATVDRTTAENPATDASVGDDVEEDAVENGQNRDARPGAVTITEGERAGMANTDKPEGASDASNVELDWSERSVDRGETDEVRQSAAYTPRPVGPPPGFQRPTERELTTPPGYPQTDVDLDQTLEQTVGEALDAAAARPAEALDEGLGGSDGRPGAESPEAESWDLTLSTDIAGNDPEPLRLPHARGGSVSRGAGALSGGLHSSTSAPPVGYRGTQPPVVPIAASPRGSTASDGPESYDGEDDDYQVVESAGRARVGDHRLAAPSPDSQAAGAYEPIGLSVLADRLGDDRGATDAPDEDDEDEFGDLGLVARGPANAAPAAVSLPLGGDENYDYDEAGEDVYDDELTAAWAPSTRRLPVVPLVLLALAVVGGAFAIGFGWLSGGATVDGLEALAAPVMAEAATERDYSEATISDADTASPLAVPAAEPPPDVPVTETPSAAPAPAAAVEDQRAAAPAPSRPSVPTPAPAPVANDGRLLIRSTPPGVQVAVNGEPRGTTPLALSDLRYDAYDVTFTFGGYETQERRLIISAADHIAAVEVRLAPVSLPENRSLGVGSIFVDTRPPGVEVWLDQRLVGETPMLLPDVAAGSHVLEFKHDGYRDWSTTVQVDSATQARVAASLLPAR